ncbi:MAG: 1-deoxy-D-xylulose-5-phosphate reductoisomerase [Cyanobacteria bacterium HKST-UBA02]|nr:1-deoxy-D-xylulose-5-phosphate reductoisomerase [Cyanobacteria bacterium HKST-UBA02]
MKRITLLGSTGSIGRQTLDIARHHRDSLEVVGLASGASSLPELAEQVLEFAPQVVSVPHKEAAQDLADLLRTKGSEYRGRITSGDDGLVEVATISDADTVVTGVVGFLGVRPTLEAIKLGKTIALANKETMVAAGPVIVPALKRYGSTIVPVDSEHSAIFQSLSGYGIEDVESIWLTGSGGPFRTWSMEAIENATIDDALKHPNWSMGPKITIDSATMMNKGLEIIEARWLFDIAPEKIEVLIHPQSILHSAVQFVDGSVVGQLGVPDMRLPIHYALFYPDRVPSARVPRLNLMDLGSLTFEHPDYQKFPCLRLAREVAGGQDTLACVLNAANEVVVEAFLKGKLAFSAIANHIERVLELHKPTKDPALDDILEADHWARQTAASLLEGALKL